MVKLLLYMSSILLFVLIYFYSCTHQSYMNTDTKFKTVQTNEEQTDLKFSFIARDSNRVKLFYGNFNLLIEQNSISGTWKIFGGDSGTLNGTLTDSLIYFKFNPKFVDNNLLVKGIITEDSIKGSWKEVGFYGVMKNGKFYAERIE